MSKHAILAPSSSERWLNCTPSARQESKEKYTTSEAAESGSLTHELGECLLRQQLHGLGYVKMNQKQLSEQVKAFERIQKHELYDNEMLDRAYGYRDFVIEQFLTALDEDPETIILLEVELKLTEFVPESFGRCDTLIISNKRLHIIDLKDGRGLVSPVQNSQLKMYSLGALHKYYLLFIPGSVFISIYQPRIANIETWETTRESLLSWGYDQLKPIAAIAFQGEGDYVPGDHCHFCKIAYKCRALADYNLETSGFMDLEFLSDEEIAQVLLRAKPLYDWLENLEKHALEQAVNHCKKWPGMKVVTGTSKRVYKNTEQVELRLLASKIPKADIYKPQEIWGITELEKRLGTARFVEYVGDLITKPDGSLKLVAESDRKPEYNSFEKAQRDFSDLSVVDNPDDLI